jgi:IstB-like ATP binding protein
MRAVARRNVSFVEARELAQILGTNLAIELDDRGLTALSAQDRADLLEILDDRVKTGSTLIASPLPVDTSHAYLGEPTLADALGPSHPSQPSHRAQCARQIHAQEPRTGGRMSFMPDRLAAYRLDGS